MTLYVLEICSNFIMQAFFLLDKLSYKRIALIKCLSAQNIYITERFIGQQQSEIHSEVVKLMGQVVQVNRTY